jgi:hypothetical protein
MKRKQIIIKALLVLFLFSGIESMAQRRVVSTPKRTVVYRKHPVVKPVRRLPRTAVVVHHAGSPFYFSSGVFYASRSGVYVRVAPPVGVRVTVLPVGFVRISIGAIPYFYFGGVFYTATPQREYVVVEPPVGAVVGKLPSNAAEVEIDGKLYYECDGTLYKPVQSKRSYEVVGKLND